MTARVTALLFFLLFFCRRANLGFSRSIPRRTPAHAWRLLSDFGGMETQKLGIKNILRLLVSAYFFVFIRINKG
jgi:hypothetical protein